MGLRPYSDFRKLPFRPIVAFPIHHGRENSPGVDFFFDGFIIGAMMAALTIAITSRTAKKRMTARRLFLGDLSIRIPLAFSSFGSDDTPTTALSAGSKSSYTGESRARLEPIITLSNDLAKHLFSNGARRTRVHKKCPSQTHTIRAAIRMWLVWATRGCCVWRYTTPP